MFQLPEPDIANAIINDLEAIKQAALHTFAGIEDPLIIHIENAISEMKNLPTESQKITIE